MIRIRKVIVNCTIDIDGLEQLEEIRAALKSSLNSKEVTFNYSEIPNDDENE
jgi:hypothetical protein